MVMLLMMLGNP